jgi:nucleoside-diphosphate-sugar epimerase
VQRLIERDGLPAAIVRPGTFFGPGDRLHFGRMADRLRRGRGVVIGSGRNPLPFVYVSDVVQGLVLASESDAAVGRAYNITNDGWLSQKDMLATIAASVGGPPPRVHLPYHALYAAASLAERLSEMSHSRRQPPVTRLGVKLFGTDNRHAIDKARRELGYAPAVTLAEGVRLSAEWYLEPAPPGGSLAAAASLAAAGGLPQPS